MEVAGITRGSLVVAVSFGTEGIATDSLVLGYTNASLIRPSMEALKQWKVAPARLDGEAVPVQMVLTFNYTLEGAVISSNIVNHFFFDHFENMGDGRFVYQIQPANGVDRAPVLRNSVKPKYAKAAEKAGINGKVQVDFYIDETGTVRMPSVRSEAHPYLAEQAVAAVREWKFEPVTDHGRPVLVAVSQEFNFDGSK